MPDWTWHGFGRFTRAKLEAPSRVRLVRRRSPSAWSTPTHRTVAARVARLATDRVHGAEAARRKVACGAAFRFCKAIGVRVDGRRVAVVDAPQGILNRVGRYPFDRIGITERTTPVGWLALEL